MTTFCQKHLKMEKLKTIGIIGGVGPEATNKFCEYLIRYKKVTKDQEHLPFIHLCNPRIPDRTEAILEEGENPIDEIVKTCKILQNSGAEFLIIPCNTAHYFLKDIQSQVEIPIIDMTQLLVKKIIEEYPPITKVGILATEGSIKTEIYQKAFKKVGVEPLIPSEETQKNLVTRAIYGGSGIKAGKKILPRKLLLKAAQELISQGAEAIIMGCTEIPLVLKETDFDIKVYDPMKIASKEIIRYLEEEEEKEVVTVSFELEEFAKKVRKKIAIELTTEKEIRKKKIAILHQELEDQERKMEYLFEKEKNKVQYVDIRKTNLRELKEFDLVINRVFASVANRNYLDNIKTLKLLKKLEEKGVSCINSYYTTKCDYSKYFSYKEMRKNNIKTPKTFFIKDKNRIEKALDFAQKNSFKKNKPIVLKRNIGGRGKDIHLIESKEKLENILLEKLENKENYQGGYILQEYIESILPYDYRISTINGKIIYSITRSFIKDEESGKEWISSMSLGSEEKIINPPEEIKKLAIEATKTIKGFFNDVDIIVGEEGPYIIENNPTPNFAKRRIESNKEEEVLSKLIEEISLLKN